MIHLFARGGNGDGTSPDWQFFILAIVMTVFAWCFVATRISIRWRQPGLHVEDWVILAAMILSTVASIFDCLAVEAGNGIHDHLLSSEQLIVIRRWYYIATLPYKFAIGLTKLSILILYFRVFVHPVFRKFALGMIIYISLFTVATGISTIFQCTPFARAWNKAIPGFCIQPTAQWYTFAGFNMSAELILFFMPMPMIKRLHLPRQQKAGLFLIFCIGFFVIFCSVFRLIVIGVQNSATDSNYTYSDGNRWTVVEVSVGIICACIPTLKAPFLRILRLFGLRSASSVPSHSQAYHMGTVEGRANASNRHSSRLSSMGSRGNPLSRKEFSQFDRISEEDMLKKEDGILKTTTIGVAYDQESRKSELDLLKDEQIVGRAT